ncbi:MAG: VWA domain-containing protein [Nitrospirae bacterium]|nr:VWA domain-containing protein [Nitrospirota bacterium]
MKDFVRGQKSKLSDIATSQQLIIALSCINSANAALDVSCFGLDANDKLSDDRYLIFYNQKSSPCGSISAIGQEGDYIERFNIDLSKLPLYIKKLVFVMTIDGSAVMSQIKSGRLSIIESGIEMAKFQFEGADFASEKALIIAELYFKDFWRFTAVGQGFNGGLSALLSHFGGTETSTPPQPQKESASGTQMESKRVSLEKKIAEKAPQLVSLVKTAQVSLQKHNLTQHTAKVALCLDISASMSALYSSGKMQTLAERVLALGCNFDDDGSIDMFLFGEQPHAVGQFGIDNFNGFIKQLLRNYPLEGGTYYGRVMKVIRNFYFPDARGDKRTSAVIAEKPVYVMFVTDGATADQSATEEQLRWSSYEPIFWQFMAIGKSKKDVKKTGIKGWFQSVSASDFAFLENLDTLSGRYVDNANFFSVEDPQHISDNELYDLLMAEYPAWLKLAKEKRLLY